MSGKSDGRSKNDLSDVAVDSRDVAAAKAFLDSFASSFSIVAGMVRRGGVVEEVKPVVYWDFDNYDERAVIVGIKIVFCSERVARRFAKAILVASGGGH